MVTHTGRGLFLGSQSRHCICANASRGLSATAEFLVRNSTTLLRSEPIARFLEEGDEDEEQQQPYAASVNTMMLFLTALSSISYRRELKCLCPVGDDRPLM